MSILSTAPEPRSPFAALADESTAGRGVVAYDLDGLGLATVLARNAGDKGLMQRVREHFAIELPQGPHRVAAVDCAWCGRGPGAWLVTCERGANLFAESLREKIGDLASVVDQSDGYAVLRLTGPKVRHALSKLVPIDVHPRAFSVGDIATTVAGHISATFWRLDAGHEGSSTFEIAVPRSFAASFWHLLAASSAEFGFVADRG